MSRDIFISGTAHLHHKAHPEIVWRLWHPHLCPEAQHTSDNTVVLRVALWDFYSYSTGKGGVVDQGMRICGIKLVVLHNFFLTGAVAVCWVSDGLEIIPPVL